MEGRNLFFITLIVANFQASHVVSFWEWTTATKQGVYLPAQFGVQNFKLSGSVELKDGNKALLDAIVYAKVIQQQDHLRVRAQIWFVDPEPSGYSHYTTSSKQVSNFRSFPEVKIRPVRTGQMYDDSCEKHACVTLKPLTVKSVSPFRHRNATSEDPLTSYNDIAPPEMKMLPVVFEGTIELQKVRDSPRLQYLCIGYWQQCGQISLDQQSQLIQQVWQDSSKPSFISVFKPFYAMPPSKAATLLHYNIAFHQQLGFNGAVAYERGSYAENFVNESIMAKLLAAGALSVLVWVPETSSMHLPASNHDSHSLWTLWDQPVIYSHAGLAFWGYNTYLFFNDYDEFLVVPQGMTVLDLLSPAGCLADLKYMELQRQNYGCHRHNTEATVAPLDTVSLDTLERYRCFDIPYWSDYPKCLVFADAAYSYEVHWGYVFKEYEASSAVVSQECMSVVHLNNLVNNRKEVQRSNSQPNSSWQWPFDAMQQPGHLSST